jgi:hypothetical protein
MNNKKSERKNRGVLLPPWAFGSGPRKWRIKVRVAPVRLQDPMGKARGKKASVEHVGQERGPG